VCEYLNQEWPALLPRMCRVFAYHVRSRRKSRQSVRHVSHALANALPETRQIPPCLKSTALAHKPLLLGTPELSFTMSFFAVSVQASERLQGDMISQKNTCCAIDITVRQSIKKKSAAAHMQRKVSPESARRGPSAGAAAGGRPRGTWGASRS